MKNERRIMCKAPSRRPASCPGWPFSQFSAPLKPRCTAASILLRLAAAVAVIIAPRAIPRPVVHCCRAAIGAAGAASVTFDAAGPETDACRTGTADTAVATAGAGTTSAEAGRCEVGAAASRELDERTVDRGTGAAAAGRAARDAAGARLPASLTAGVEAEGRLGGVA